jgi:LPXTG-motif cell wall-anchored protein
MSLKVLFRVLSVVSALMFLAVGSVPRTGTVQAAGSMNQINHIIVIYQENRSFDSLYGNFPGANGLANAGAAVNQVDKNNQPYATLPQPLNTSLKPPGPDTRIPANLPVQPFDLSKYIAPTDKTGDMVHRYYQEQYQIDGGKMDKYVAWTDSQGLVMGYYDATNMPEGQLAQQYTMDDDFFHAAFGGSFLNHFWLICACSPTWPNAPAGKVAQLDANGKMVKDGAVTPDGYAINTSFTVNTPHPANITDTTQLVPEQTQPNIGDRLNDKGISWAWYAGGWNNAVAGKPDPLFQFHHQPFAFFANNADNTPGRAAHLKDETDFMTALQTNSLPAVSFIKPIGDNNEHPGYASLAQGQQHVADLVNAVKNSPYWADSAIIVTYDENGGAWDHVAPPVVDKWGPGTRIPTIVISPFAKKGFVDHTQYDTTSILKTIEMRWDLPALGTRDAAANPLTNSFDFGTQGGTTPGMPSTGQSSNLWLLVAAGAGLLLLGLSFLFRYRTTSRSR